MSKNKKVKSNIIGLDMGLVFGRFFLNSEDLHFGYWPSGEKATAQNFAWAQENHSNLIIDAIPKKTKHILDVGSGSGNLALNLLNRGYYVDCVIPSNYLARSVKKKIKDRGNIHISKFENINLHNTYDLIIFSESFQYINMEISFPIIQKLLTPGGHLLICDFFKLNIPQESLMGGGHLWEKFLDQINKTNLKIVSDFDMTIGSAPTIDFLDRFGQEVLGPIGKMLFDYMISNYPKITKLFMWRFKKRINKIKLRYLSGKINGESFKKFKTYRLLLYKSIK